MLNRVKYLISVSQNVRNLNTTIDFIFLNVKEDEPSFIVLKDEKKLAANCENRHTDCY